MLPRKVKNMRIANNIISMTVNRYYNINLQALSKNAERLASGYRINRAADDPAGLAISERMRAQIRALNMATRNAQDGISAIQTAEGALDRVHAILQRMNELAVQSANGTNLNLDRNALMAEFSQLREEINDISGQANFNDKNLFDGSLRGKTGGRSGAISAVPAAITNIAISDIDGFTVSNTGRYYIEANDQEIKMFFSGLEVEKKTWDEIGFDPGNPGSINFELNQLGTTLNIDYSGTKKDVMDALNKVEFNVKNSSGGSYNDVGLVLQVGAKEGNTLAISIDAMSSEHLGLDDLDISTMEGAGKAITAVGNAINRISAQRSYLGALHNRMEHKIENLTNTALNLQDAESRIRDADIAKEMTEFIKNSIRIQAAIAILAQTNSMGQNVLKLLEAM